MELNVESMEYEITLLEKLLGTVPKDKEIYASYIAAKAPRDENAQEEIVSVDEVEERGWTGFHSDSKGLFIYDYMIKGFLKAACETLQANGVIKKIPAYKKWFDKLVFVYPRRLYFGIKEPDGVLERPLRVMTPKGPRVSLARSDFINEGRKIKCEVRLLTNNKISWDLIEACFKYGEFCALGQWRGSGGYGRIKVKPLSK